jgi:hypothetical protein
VLQLLNDSALRSFTVLYREVIRLAIKLCQVSGPAGWFAAGGIKHLAAQQAVLCTGCV